MACVGLVQGRGLFGVYLFDEFCGYAAPELTVSNPCIAKHKRSCRYNGSASDYGMVKDSCSHSYECAVTDFASVQRYGVADSNVVP